MSLILSIVIPVYNTENFLSECLESLRGLSSFRDKAEVIVVDDASPGDPERITRNYESILNLKYFRHQTNSSVFQARKTGIEHARGLYVLSLDSDDYLISMDWAELLKRLEGRGLDILQYAIAREKKELFDLEDRTVSSDDVWKIFVESMHWQLAGSIVKKSLFLNLFDKLSSYDGSQYINMADDLCFSAGLFNVAKIFETHSRLGYYCYRTNLQSLTKSKFGEDKEKTVRIGNDYLNCRLIANHFLSDPARQKDFQALLDSNIPWIVPKIHTSLSNHPELWGIYAKAFSEDKLFQYVLDKDIDLCLKIVTSSGETVHAKQPVKNIAVLRDEEENNTEVPLAEILSERFNFFSICSATRGIVEDSVPRNTLVISGEEDNKVARLNLCRNNHIDTVLIEDPDSQDTFKEILFLKYHRINVLVRENKPFSYPLFVGKPELLVMKEKVYKACDLLICSNEADSLFWRGLGISKAIHLPAFLKSAPVPSSPKTSAGNRILLIGIPNPLNGISDLMEIIRYVCNRSEQIVFEVFDAFVSSYDKSRFTNELSEFIEKEKVVILEAAEEVGERVKNASLLLASSSVEDKAVYVAQAQSVGTPILRMSPHALNILEPGQPFFSSNLNERIGQKLLEIFSDIRSFERFSASAHGIVEEELANTLKDQWISHLTNLHSFVGFPSDSNLSRLSRQFQNGLEYVDSASPFPLTQQASDHAPAQGYMDPVIQRKLRRYDKMVSVFNKFFRPGSLRRRLLKRLLSKLSAYAC